MELHYIHVLHQPSQGTRASSIAVHRLLSHATCILRSPVRALHPWPCVPSYACALSVWLSHPRGCDSIKQSDSTSARYMDRKVAPAGAMHDSLTYMWGKRSFTLNVSSWLPALQALRRTSRRPASLGATWDLTPDACVSCLISLTIEQLLKVRDPLVYHSWRRSRSGIAI